MAEELRTVLGFEAAGAIATLAKLATSLDVYSAALMRSATTNKTFNTSASVTRSGLISTASATNTLSNAQNKGITSAKSYTNSLTSIKQAAVQIGANLTGTDNSVRALNSSLNSGISSAKKYVNTLTGIKQSSGLMGLGIIGASSGTNQLSAAQNKGITSAKSYTNSLTGVRNSTTKLTDTTKKASGSMLLSWKSVIRIFAIQVIHQAISKISGALKQSAEDAREYVKALSEIQTIADGGFGSLENLAAKVEEFSAATGQPLTAVTEGIYQTLSNQVADAAHSFEFLQTASDFSIAAVTDLGSSVELLSSIINSYNLNTSDAAEISGKLFRAIELGRFRGEEIADTIGRITVLSSQLGVSLEETLASITVLTRSGMKYDEAFTLVSNIQLKLIKPTQNLKNLFKEMGIATSEAGIQAYGFQGLLAEIEKSAGSTASELANLYGRVRAIRGALGLGSKYMETYTSDLKELKEAAAETIKGAKTIVFETNARQVELELNRLNIALVGFGRVATDVTKVVFDSFGGATGTIATFTTALALGATTWLLMRSNVVAATTAIISRIQAVGLKTAVLNRDWMKLVKSPILWAAVVVGAVTIISYSLNRYIKKAKEARDALVAESTGKETVKLANYKIELQEQVENNKKILSEAQKMLFAKQKLYNDASSNIRRNEEIMFGSLEDQLGDHVSAINGLFGKFRDFATDLPSKLREIASETKNIRANINDWKFDRSIQKLNTIQEIYKRLERSQQLRSEALAASNRGENDLAKSVNERALNEAKSALATADQSGNRVLIRKAEQEVELAMQNQLSTQERIKKQSINQATAINESVASMNRFSAAIGPAVDEFKKLTEELKKTSDPIDREKIIAKMKGVVGEIKEMLKLDMYIDLANTPELHDELASVSKSFYDALTGQVTTFEHAVTNSISRLNALRAKTPDVSEQQASGVEMKKQLDITTKALASQAEAQGKLRTAIIDADKTYDKFGATVDKAATSAKITANERSGQTARMANDIKAAYKVELDAALKLAAEGKANTTEYSARVTNIINLNTLLRKSSEDATKGGFIEWTAGAILGTFGLFDSLHEAAVSGQELVDKLNELPEIEVSIKEEGAKAEVGKAFMDKMAASTDPVKDALTFLDAAATNTGQNIDTSLSTGIINAVANVARGSSSIISSLETIAEQARVTAAAVASIGSGVGATGKAYGGMIYRAGGGFTPRGTDTIPAMLSPGEFVVNAASSRKFFSQLVAMNSGRQPVYRETGGSVGDININVTESKSPQATAREIATQIRREISRKTIRKF